MKPDILFPGSDIVSCRADDTSLGSALDLTYTEVSGTSMAAPHAAGVAALLLEANPGLTPREIKELMMRSAVHLGLDENAEGAGRGDASAALATSRCPEEPSQSSGCLVYVPQLLGLLGRLWRSEGAGLRA
jgi:subtilisin family serine protease